MNLVDFMCTACKSSSHYFLFRYADDGKSVAKVGQYPPWSIDPEPSIKKALGGHLTEYKKGLINESQGYGIGAFAYYRRIVENLIDGLLDEIGEFITREDEHREYLEALERVRGDYRAEIKIDAIKDLIPDMLRAGNVNPLRELHGALSQGLHAESDEECLELAGSIRESMVYLVEEVTQRKRRAQDYAASITSLREKRSKKGPADPGKDAQPSSS